MSRGVTSQGPPGSWTHNDDKAVTILFTQTSYDKDFVSLLSSTDLGAAWGLKSRKETPGEDFDIEAESLTQGVPI